MLNSENPIKALPPNPSIGQLTAAVAWLETKLGAGDLDAARIPGNIKQLDDTIKALEEGVAAFEKQVAGIESQIAEGMIAVVPEIVVSAINNGQITADDLASVEIGSDGEQKD